MSEWWTYRPADFLMFAPRTYWRLFELQNAAWWPAPWVFSLLAMVLAIGLWRRHAQVSRMGLIGAALAWAWVAWSFLWQRYTPINWAASASASAIAFALQALGLLVLAWRQPPLATTPGHRRLGLGLLLWAVCLHPALPLAFGRPWAQAEVIGLAPDPTAIATLGLLLCLDVHPRTLPWVLRAGATAWLLLSAATLATLGSAQAVVPLAAALLALVSPGPRAAAPAA